MRRLGGVRRRRRWLPGVRVTDPVDPAAGSIRRPRKRLRAATTVLQASARMRRGGLLLDASVIDCPARQPPKIAVGNIAVTTMLGTSGNSLMRRSTATLQIAYAC